MGVVTQLRDVVALTSILSDYSFMAGGLCIWCLGIKYNYDYDYDRRWIQARYMLRIKHLLA